jgi:cytochrome c oxidase subunit IV
MSSAFAGLILKVAMEMGWERMQGSHSHMVLPLINKLDLCLSLTMEITISERSHHKVNHFLFFPSCVVIEYFDKEKCQQLLELENKMVL